MMKFVVFALLFIAAVQCQETADDDATVEERKEKRGISLNLGSGVEGYSYLGPSSYGRQFNRGYTPTTEFGYDGVNYGYGASNFAGGYQGGYQGYNPNIATGSYPYRGGYPTSYSYQRQYNTPVNTFPLGGIGTVGPYGGAAYGGFNGYNGGYNRFGDASGGYQQPYQQPYGGLQSGYY